MRERIGTQVLYLYYRVAGGEIWQVLGKIVGKKVKFNDNIISVNKKDHHLKCTP